MLSSICSCAMRASSGLIACSRFSWPVDKDDSKSVRASSVDLEMDKSSLPFSKVSLEWASANALCMSMYSSIVWLSVLMAFGTSVSSEGLVSSIVFFTLSL